MNAMKTPEQIVAERLAELDMAGHTLTSAFTSGWFTGDLVPDLMREAIEADRKQRAEMYRGLVTAYAEGAYDADGQPYEGVEWLGDALTEIVEEVDWPARSAGREERDEHDEDP